MNILFKAAGLAVMILGLGVSIQAQPAHANENGSFFGTFGDWLATPPKRSNSALNIKPKRNPATFRSELNSTNVTSTRRGFRFFRDRNGNIDWHAYAVDRVSKDEALQTGTTGRVVSYYGQRTPGSIVISTSERRLYLVLPGRKARAYDVGVGRPGYEWYGSHKISRKSEWPDWRPPAEMRKRQPYLPEFMPGGPGNPLGARALYLGSTIYRIHGTIESHTIGSAVSSGCIRMLNQDVIDLYNRVKVGVTVHVEA